MIYWESAHRFIERQTEALEREYHSSRPEPRGWAMGFRYGGRRWGRGKGLNEGYGWGLVEVEGKVHYLPRWAMDEVARRGGKLVSWR